jgi:hypothetical protein
MILSYSIMYDIKLKGHVNTVSILKAFANLCLACSSFPELHARHRFEYK